jgi:hypothetical protein
MDTATIDSAPATNRVCTLPDTIIGIVSYLSGKELVKASHINKQWRAVCLERVKLSDCGVSFKYSCDNEDLQNDISRVSRQTHAVLLRLGRLIQ